MNNIYLAENAENLNSDLITRKEFQIFKKNLDLVKFKNEQKEKDEQLNIVPRFFLKKDVQYLELRSYQLFVRNFMNPNTPYSRLLLKYQTGMGKTLASISIALQFINYYQKQAKQDEIGSIFIIGFTKKIFQDEMLKYPELGFITRDEINTMEQLQKQNQNEYKKFLSHIKKRFTSRQGNGFFKFIGYKELFNKLFIIRKSVNLELNKLSEKEIREALEKGLILINESFLYSFKNSLIICDEIHNVYNTAEKNNWGVALQLVLDQNPDARAMFLSATPLNNSPSEVIDLLNLLLPHHDNMYPMLNKQDFFENDNFTNEQQLADYFKGRVSFIKDKSSKFLATKQFVGESIKNIQFLKFIRCPMSSFQYKTYENAFNNSQFKDIQNVLDFAIPDPQHSNFSNPGIYRSRDIEDLSDINNQKWKKLGISYSKQLDGLTGPLLEENKIGIISEKYKQMISTIKQLIKDRKGKIFIYHNNIHMSGTLFIKEVLLYNNIIGEFDNSNENTICVICAKKRSEHSKYELDETLFQLNQNENKHFYQPVRFVIVNSTMDRNTVNNSLAKFNNLNNVDGSKFLILLGSKIIKESYSINSVRNLFVMARPENISSLIQIIGRVIRINSHAMLPIDQRHVDVRLFVTSLPGKNKLSYEEEKYQEKIAQFKIIQKIEKLMHENAIDAYFNYPTIWDIKEKITKQNYKTKLHSTSLDILPYYVDYSYKPSQMNLLTFNAYHKKTYVDYIIYIIKRLFVQVSSIWKFKDLLAAVKQPPFDVEINTQVIDKEFNIALGRILYVDNENYKDLSTEPIFSANIMDKLQNPDDKVIVQQENRFVITQRGEMFMLVPIYKNSLFISPESPFRTICYQKDEYVSLKNFNKEIDNMSFDKKKQIFIDKWRNVPLVQLEPALYDFGIKFHQQLAEFIIQYVFHIWTDPKQNKIQDHDFYIKILYYYDIQKIIIWAHTLNQEQFEKYTKYVTPVKMDMNNIDKNIQKELKKENSSLDLDLSQSESGSINLLISSLNRSAEDWISSQLVEQYDQRLLEIEKLYSGIYKKSDTVKKIRADYLPVGHFLSKPPRFYLPNKEKQDSWYSNPLFMSTITSKENNIIIGLDVRLKDQIEIKFKIRNPKNGKQQRDARLIETGLVCTSRKKTELQSIAKKLNIDPSGSNHELCSKIRTKLIYNELKERVKKTGIRYFYFVYENQ